MKIGFEIGHEHVFDERSNITCVGMVPLLRLGPALRP